MQILKIKDLEENQTRTIPLIIIDCSIRMTATKKPYLAATFSDGEDMIKGNFWDYRKEELPAKNKVFDISAQVQTYQGAKQLNIHNLIPNTTLPLTAFLPSSGLDVEDIYKQAMNMVDNLKDTVLKRLLTAVFEQLKPMWLFVPGAKTVHHAFIGGTLIHSVSVARIARGMAVEIDGANIDLTVAGALLHDLGKLFTYSIDGVTINMTNEGMLFDHIAMTFRFLSNFASNIFNSDEEEEAADKKLDLLQHVLLAHHTMEHGSPVPPLCIEALIVAAADSVDARAQSIRDAAAKVEATSMWTDRVWTFDNKPVLVPHYIQSVFAEETESGGTVL